MERVSFSSQNGRVGDSDAQLRSRVPGIEFGEGRLRLERTPDLRRREGWQRSWNPMGQCSFEPEDLVIENFRDYVGKRALSLARVESSRTEPFQTSFYDGIDLRATLRDVIHRKIHVREEKRTAGEVGALVVIFEEDDYGVRFPWRTTWYAEHHNESTLAFYATDFGEEMIGPGIARAYYGGFMMLFPPILTPDIWDDLRFERARTPSERMLLAAVYWSPEHYIVKVGGRPLSEGVRREATKRRKHILQLPTSTFSSRTLERLRRVHVLNGQQVRSWAHRFIR